MATYYTNALNSGYAWSSSGVLTEITYTYNSSQGNMENGSSYNLFNAYQVAAAESVFAHFENIANVNMINSGATSADGTDIILRAMNISGGTAGYAYYPSNYWGSDVLIDNDYSSNNGNYYSGLEPGNFGYGLFLHELGHAVGLDHPHENTVLPAAEDSMNLTIMSYDSSDSSKVGGDIASLVGPNTPTTLQLYDIATLQEIYGANNNYNAGDDTYTLSGATEVYTIWDGAGTDTISTSSYTGAATIDLREGAENITHVGATKVWIAFNANIENAIAGNGNDVLYGNSLANTIYGGGGNDTITGDVGADWIQGNSGIDSLMGGSGADTIYGGRDGDFLQGNSEGDFINGNLGNDTIYGGRDNDTLYGGQENDFINGNKNNDIVSGDKGSDTLYGGSGDDSLSGGNDNDILSGDKGSDTLTGGNGDDTFVFNTISGLDTITDFTPGFDIIQLSPLVKATAAEAFSSLSYTDVGATLSLSIGNFIVLEGIIDGVMSEGSFVIL